MRVAIVQEHVDVRRGGAETSTVEMARQLAALGPSVTILCRHPRPDPFVEENVTIWPIATPQRTRLGQTYHFVKTVQQVCRREPFDIVHAVTPCLSANVYQPRGGTYAETIARSLAPAPSSVRWLRALGRRFNMRQRFLLRLERLLLRKYVYRVTVAALSEYVRRQVVTGYGVPTECVRLVFNGVEIAPMDSAERARLRGALRSELDLAEATPAVLFVAHNFKLKGLKTLLAATAGGTTPWTLLVAGRDDPRPYQRQAHRLGIANRVRFLGADTPVRSCYAAADALAHPTWYDPCSRVVLEALSVGLPVVTTAYNGAAEVIESGRQGEVIAEPNDHVGLAAALERILNSEVRAACKEDATRLHAQLSMARHARELHALYQQLLEGDSETL